MTQSVPFDAYLGASKTGQAIGCIVYQLDGSTVYSAFSTSGWYEAPSGSGDFHHTGVVLPDAGGVVAVGVSGTEYKRLSFGPAASSGGATAADVWSYAYRTLTSTAVETASTMAGSDITITRSVTFSATVTGISFPALWEKVYFTVKENNVHPDVQAVIQVFKYNGSGNDGLIRLNKGAATAAQGSLTANSSAGTVTITLTDDATVQLYYGNYVYDLKFIISDGTSEVITQGNCYVRLTSTEAIA